jgi:hypothetical protein
MEALDVAATVGLAVADLSGDSSGAVASRALGMQRREPMKKPLRSIAWLLTMTLPLGGALLGCPSPKMPTGAAPEYEEPAAPTWLKDASAAPMPTPAPPVLKPVPPDDAGVPRS